jgi:peptidyl-prolyl cis-trans isomerase C
MIRLTHGTEAAHRRSAAARSFVLCFALALAVVGCGDKKQEEAAAPAPAEKKAELKNGLTPEQSNQVLAKIGDTTITLGEFADRLGNQSPYLRARYGSPERRREFLDNMVRFELLALEAKKRGQEQQPDVERVRRQMMVQEMMKQMFDDNGIKLSDITDDEIKAYYDAHAAEFHKPAQRRASHILYKDKAKAEAALKKLTNAGGDMETFRKLAKEDNQDAETKDRFGDLRFFSLEPEAGESAPPKPVREAAFSLEKTGALYGKVIESEQGFHVLELTGERAALDRSMQDARRLIQNRLWREKREAAIDKFVGDLRSKADVKENLDLLGQVKIDTTTPAAGRDDVDDMVEEQKEKEAAHPPKAEADKPAPALRGGAIGAAEK